MRRLFWMGVGAAAAVSGERWLARTWQQASDRQAVRRQGRPPRSPGTALGSSPAVPEVLGSAVSDVVGPTAEVVGALGAVAGRQAGRLASMGARRVGQRVRQAVEGGQADARARERDLRRSMRRPASQGPLGHR